MSIAKICTGAVLVLLLMLTVKKERAEYALLTEIAGTAVLLYFLLTFVSSLTGTINALTFLGEVKNGYAAILIKSLGICVTAEITADICRDNGASALAAIVETAGKLLILALCSPLLLAAVKAGMKMIGGE